MKILYVVRHAEAEHNVSNVLNDSTSLQSALTLNGVKQAQALAEKLGNIHFDAVFTSELERIIETAHIINKYNAAMFKDERLSDIRTGMQGASFDEFRNALQTTTDTWNARFNDGESFEDEKARTIDFLHDLKNMSYNKILIVTHGGVANIIYGLAHHLNNEETFNREIDNASYFSCDLEDLL